MRKSIEIFTKLKAAIKIIIFMSLKTERFDKVENPINKIIPNTGTKILIPRKLINKEPYCFKG